MDGQTCRCARCALGDGGSIPPTSKMISSICVFCGSSDGSDPSYGAAARDLGTLLAARSITLVYGGGNVGTMGTLAAAAMKGGGEVVGIIPDKLNGLVEHLELTELLVVKDMHERKALMQNKADAFLALPGGIGTMEELFEVWSWRYIGYHAKPVGLININGFYDDLMKFLSGMVGAGFLRQELFSDLVIAGNPADALDLLLKKGSEPALSFLKVAERSR